ncbi:TonB-dependent receptor [Pseudotamlana carrageenivorans]|uniref:TonB-dependent receptor n=1 Tax=Pseudotamlana carrageenivorans TaxID=2069432 RepID=A0A2I7SGJ5_9FLAO|nr:TonB-dependent receptor [Tamlana carrageenivorans]AUS05028.1 TonB-dependent receptor [Tamlana carrageenivorans]
MRIKICLYLLTLTSFLLGHSITAQNKASLSGTVSDEFGKLPGARISVEGTNIQTTTNIDGFYSLNLEEGSYVITASFIMYQTKSVSITIKVGDALIKDFILETGLSADEPVSLGTRSKPQSSLETTVPIEIITPEQISGSTHFELSEILHYLSPSFHSTHQTISDGTDHIDPVTLRGLGPDQVLILINGKRRHTSSMLNVNGTIGRGSVGTDFNAIPVSSIDYIEILRDGATPQYGSDAIAGVINIILKNQTDVIHIDSRIKTNIEGDGVTSYFSANFGLKVGNTGFINITGEFRDRKATNRAGHYTGPVYSQDETEDAALIKQNNFFAQTGYNDKQVMEIGSAAVRNSAIYFNGEFLMFKKANLYFFGGRNSREGASAGFYRFPFEKDRVTEELFPNGFSPKIITNIQDNALTIGLKGQKNDWNLDFSHSIENNNIDFTVSNSNNASLGVRSPKTFKSGGYLYKLNTTNIDLDKEFDVLEGLSVAFGGELRVEGYEIISGEEDSYINGGETYIDENGVEQPRLIGAQVFPGIQPSDELIRIRSNASGYIDLELKPLEPFLFKAAYRFESNNDFGENSVWKLSGRYLLNKNISFRSSYSTGFRAPSLHQVYFQKISTQYFDGDISQVGTFNHESSLITDVFKVNQLTPELSKHFSLGWSSKFKNKYTFAFDYYNININDRIILSGGFSTGYEAQLAPYEVSAAQFFVNAIDSNTNGFEASFIYQDKLGSGLFNGQVATNFTKTKVTNVNENSVENGDLESLFNREERSRVESAQPNFKINSYFQYEIHNFKFNLVGTYFGSLDYLHPDDGDPNNWQLNKYNGRVETRDQRFKPKFITDLAVSYRFVNFLEATAGCNNIFNIYPDKHRHSGNTNNGSFIYSRRVQQFGVSGANCFFKILLRL